MGVLGGFPQIPLSKIHYLLKKEDAKKKPIIFWAPNNTRIKKRQHFLRFKEREDQLRFSVSERISVDLRRKEFNLFVRGYHR